MPRTRRTIITTANKYKCPFCGYSVNSERGLRLHYKMNHQPKIKIEELIIDVYDLEHKV